MITDIKGGYVKSERRKEGYTEFLIILERKLFSLFFSFDLLVI
jgi:hypothetical protein